MFKGWVISVHNKVSSIHDFWDEYKVVSLDSIWKLLFFGWDWQPISFGQWENVTHKKKSCIKILTQETLFQGKGSVLIVPPKDEDCESTSSKSSGKSSRVKRQVNTTGTETETEHPLRTLVKAARYMNPVQFDVGKEISCNVPLPGQA